MGTRSQRWRFLPPGATPDAAVLLRARAVRAFGDGFVSVLLPLHLATLGFGKHGRRAPKPARVPAGPKARRLTPVGSGVGR